MEWSLSLLPRGAAARAGKRAGSFVWKLSACLSFSACSLQSPGEEEVFGPSRRATGGASSGGAAAAFSGGMPAMALGGATASQGGSGGTGATSGETGGAAASAVDIKRGLVAHYAFDEKSGDTVVNAKDSSQNGSCVGACLHPTGVLGGAIGLRNSERNENWVELPSGLLNGMTATTVVLWVRDLSSSRKDSPVLHFSRGTNEVLYLVPDDVVPDTSTSGCSFGVKHLGAQIISIRDGQSLTGGNWHHIAITWTATAASLYIDSVRVGSRANPGALPGDLGVTSPNYLGRALSDDIPAINADLDELRIYDRALASDELDALYELR